MKDTSNENTGIILKGAMEAAIRSAKDNEIVSYRHRKNTVVTAGRRWVLERIQSASPPANTIGYMAVGTGTQSLGTDDTALSSEAAGSRKAIGTMTTTNLTSNPPSWAAQTSWATNEATTTLGEVGLFNSSSAGTMLARATFNTIDKETSNTLSITYTISN
jgi:hypothetical protein